MYVFMRVQLAQGLAIEPELPRSGGQGESVEGVNVKAPPRELSLFKDAL